MTESNVPRGLTFGNFGNSLGIFGTTDDSGAIANLIEKGYKQTTYTIGGILGIKLTKSQQDYIYFNKNSDYYRIAKSSSKDIHETECTEEFNQILSTFKFTK